MTSSPGGPQAASQEVVIAALQHMVRSRDLAAHPETTEALSRIAPNAARYAVSPSCPRVSDFCGRSGD